MLYRNAKENEAVNTQNSNSLEKIKQVKSNKKSFIVKNKLPKENQNINSNGILENNNKQEKNAFEELIDYIPEYQYDIKPKHKKLNKSKKDKDAFNVVPLDLFETNNNRFYDLYEAFLYISKHCKKYHGKFTREYCKRYLKECYIIDFVHDDFVPITKNLPQKQFNKYFYHAQRELKYL